jgi:serine/threonine protein kinase
MADSDNSAENDARVGTTLGKWKLDRLIGVGGMASVYAASHRNGAVAALKILHPEFARRADARTRFMREAYIANRAGPGAVRVLDDDVDDEGAPYLVMELLTGEAVDARARRMGGRLKVLEVLWIAHEMLTTLEVAHAQGIIHRDLKPENLFWTVDDTLKVLDFGIARLHANTTERTVAGMVMGTPDFMAPEQALGRTDEMDGRTDIFATGAIMFNLLTGRDVHPRTDKNPLVQAATTRAVSIGDVDSTLPREVVAVVDRALQFERDARYPSAKAMRDDIERFVGTDDMTPSIPSVRFAVSSAVPSATFPGGPPAPAAPAGQARSSKASAATAFPSHESPSLSLASGMSEESTDALRELFSLIELTLLSRAQIEERGEQRWLEAAHLGSFRKLQMAYRHAVTALSTAHIGLFWNVEPGGFATKQGLLWIAKPPLPPTPASMYEGGVRMLGLLPGLALEEFGEIVRLINGDIAPFTDFATFLQASQLEHLVHRIDPTKPGMPEHESMSIDSTMSGQANVPAMLEALVTSDPALRAAVLKRLERLGDGNEKQVGALLSTSGLELSMGLLRVLQALGTPAGREAMLEAKKNAAPIVRIEALATLEPSGERLSTEIRDLLGAADARARLDGLVALETYRIKAAGPALALRARSPSFDVLPLEERRQALSTLGVLLPERAEKVAIGLLQDQRAMSAQEHESTRELACELLGRVGTAREAREALDAAAMSRFRTTEGVRQAARFALDAFDARAADAKKA